MWTSRTIRVASLFTEVIAVIGGFFLIILLEKSVDYYYVPSYLFNFSKHQFLEK